jgi:multidrug efflux system membrane fusion protein
MNALTPFTQENKPRLDQRRKPALRPAIAGVTLAALVIAGSFVILRKPATSQAAALPPTVAVATPLLRRVSEWDDYVGRFEAIRTVEVRPRVSGQITAIHFTDGAMVREGQLLFSIDRRLFAAAFAEAKAGLASAHSEAALAQADLARAQKLSEDEAVSQSELDRLRARVQASQANVAGAQARVEARALELGFTEVRAPISGRVSNRRVDAGNLVMAGEGAGAPLTTINALDPIYLSFDASEALLLKAKRAGAERAPPVVDVRLQDEADFRWHGRVDFTDNGLDPRSGTIRLRATIRNPSLFLTPGMFGSLRMASGQVVNALLVPDAAIQTDQMRKTVLTVAADGTVVAKPVELGPLVDGLRIVRSGLNPSDRVVVTGVQLAAPGSKVTTKPGRITPVALPPTPSTPTSSSQATFAS